MSDILERHPEKFDMLINYGESAQQFAQLRSPPNRGPFPLLFVIHGGFWQNRYDLSHISHLCAALTNSGIVTCSLEYRRIGDRGGGWPGTFLDASLAVDRILEKVSTDSRIDLTRIGVIGHSAGGHLALWLACRNNVPGSSPVHYDGKNRVLHAISLAGVSDLREAWREKLGSGAVSLLIGGSSDEFPDRYDAGSPIELLPSGADPILIHGADDDIVPVSQSERFAEKANRLGDHHTLVKLDGVGHFELIDPESEAWASVEKTVLSMFNIR